MYVCMSTYGERHGRPMERKEMRRRRQKKKEKGEKFCSAVSGIYEVRDTRGGQEGDSEKTAARTTKSLLSHCCLSARLS